MAKYESTGVNQGATFRMGRRFVNRLNLEALDLISNDFENVLIKYNLNDIDVTITIDIKET